jgi:histidinol-phosphate aminotransferase
MRRSEPPFKLARDLYREGPAYIFAKKPEEIAKEFGFDRIARLASNENPFGPSPMAIKHAELALSGMHRYPDSTNISLINALRSYHGDYEFVTGVGMDGVIETSIRALVNPGDKVTISTPTFSFYGLAASAQGAEVNYVSRNEDFSVDISTFIKAAEGSKISFLCTPNNPSGTVTTVEDIEEILNKIDGILFLDNAYVEFSEIDYRPLIKCHENLVIGRTMSKVFGLAGCRVGYAFVPSWFRQIYEKASTPFTLNVISVAAATGALQDREYIERTISYTKDWRERFITSSSKPVQPSGANFIMIDTSPLTGDEASDILAKNGVLVRSCRSFPGLADHYIRVCIGEEWENKRWLEGLSKL